MSLTFWSRNLSLIHFYGSQADGPTKCDLEYIYFFLYIHFKWDFDQYLAQFGLSARWQFVCLLALTQKACW